VPRFSAYSTDDPSPPTFGGGTTSPAVRVCAPLQALTANPRLSAWLTYWCYEVEGVATPICNLQGFIRHPEDIPLAFQLAERDSPWPLQLNSLHDGGMVFSTGTPVAIGVGIDMDISLHGETLKLHGCVTHCFELEGHYEVGVQFHATTDHYTMRMVEQACHIEHYYRICRQEGRQLTLEDAAYEWINRFAERFPQ
jgi:hypothetical protein